MTVMHLFNQNRSECKRIIIIPLSKNEDMILSLGLMISYNLVTI